MNTSLRAFKKKVLIHKNSFRRFLTSLEKNTPRKLDQLVMLAEQQVWPETDCLRCANCCKTMTPTYTPGDIRRIAVHLGITQDQFKLKWLRKERNTGDWLNKSTPCQFLNPMDNKCSIYEVRPADCAGFPHLSKKRMIDYMHVHKQNIESCPASFKLVEKMIVLVKTGRDKTGSPEVRKTERPLEL
ncbi:MAG: YkgJ family cysteine cluster protein [Chitinophagaceae bacterium]|nr:YkgJ family cysteine cluster protein [Chitinophagaceae bacterium]